MNVLITGVGGFIAAHLARRLLRDGHSVVGVDDLSSGFLSNVPKGLDFIKGDLADAATYTALPRNVDAILHLAGQSSGERSFSDPIADLKKNTHSTLNLIKYGIDVGARHIIYASSMSVYGAQASQVVDEAQTCRPMSCYGVGKLASEDYLHVFETQLPATIFRIFNVYGPGQNLADMQQGMVSIFLAQALNGGSVHVKGSLDRFRDFIYIDDVVEAWMRALTTEAAKGKTINLGTGRLTYLHGLLGEMKNLIPNMNWFSEGGTPGDQFGIVADTRFLGTTLKMQEFTGLAEGLKKFHAWASRRDEA